MRSPREPKEVQSLNGPIAVLNRFIPKAMDNALLQDSEALKKHLRKAPLLSNPKPSKPHLLYLAMSKNAINTVLIKKEETCKLPVYYISKALLPVKARYPDI